MIGLQITVFCGNWQHRKKPKLSRIYYFRLAAASQRWISSQHDLSTARVSGFKTNIRATEYLTTTSPSNRVLHTTPYSNDGRRETLLNYHYNFYYIRYGRRGKVSQNFFGQNESHHASISLSTTVSVRRFSAPGVATLLITKNKYHPSTIFPLNGRKQWDANTTLNLNDAGYLSLSFHPASIIFVMHLSESSGYQRPWLDAVQCSSFPALDCDLAFLITFLTIVAIIALRSSTTKGG